MTASALVVVAIRPFQSSARRLARATDGLSDWLSRPWILFAAMVLLQIMWLLVEWIVETKEAKLVPVVLLCTTIACIPAALLLVHRHRCAAYLETRRRVVLPLVLLALVVCGFVHAAFVLDFSDERNAFQAAQIVAQEGVKGFFARYTSIPWLNHQHPPLAPLLHGTAMKMTAVNLFIARLVSLTFASGTLVITYLLGRDLYDRGTGVLAVLMMAAFPLFWRSGIEVHNDTMVLFCFTFAVYLTIRLHRAPSFPLALFIGAIVGCGLLSKYTMLLIFPVIAGWLLIHGKLDELKFHLATIVAVSMTAGLSWLAFANHLGVFELQQRTLVRFAGCFVGSDYGKRMFACNMGISLPQWLGVGNLPLLLVGGWQVVRRWHRPERFLLLWIAAVSLPIAFTLPNARYFLPMFPALAILVAVWLRSRIELIAPIISLALLLCWTAELLRLDWSQPAF